MTATILNQLLIADRLTARRQAQREKGCNILALGEHDPASWGGHGKRIWVPLSDGLRILPQDFLRAVDALQVLWREGSPVIVCCHAGESRSSAVVVGWLLLHQHEIVAEMQNQPLVPHELPVLFRETHRWVCSAEEAKRQEVSDVLLRSPLLPVVLCCYGQLSLVYPRVMINVGLWITLIESKTFDALAKDPESRQ